MNPKLALSLLVATFIGGLLHLSAATLTPLSDSASPSITTGTGFPPPVTLPLDGGDAVENIGGSPLQSSNPGSRLYNAVFVFQLPSLGSVSSPFEDASFTATIGASSGASAFGFNPGGNNYDLYALGSRSTPAVLASDFYAGGADSTDAALLADNFAGVDFSYASYVAGTDKTTGTSALLTSHLNAAYAGGAGAGQYVFLRINPDFNVNSFSNLAWDTAASTAITYSVIPEPASLTLVVFGCSAFCWNRRRRR